MSKLLSILVLIGAGAALAQDSTSTAVSHTSGQTTPANGKYVKLEFGNSATLTVDERDRLGARFGISPERDVKLAKLVPSVWDVAVGTEHSPKLRACFNARMDDVEQGAPAIVIIYDCDALAAGTYDVTLALRHGAEPPVQRLALQLKRNATEIRTISAQTVQRVVYFPSATPKLMPPELIVTAAAPQAPLNSVSAQQVAPIVSGDSQTTGKLHFGPATSTDTTGNARLPITFTGDVPYGKGKTTVRVTANELAAPVYVPFDIETRFHEWLLIPAIGVGLLLGWLMRTVLKGLIERRQTRLAVLDLIDKIEEAARTTPDAMFTGKAIAIVTRLRNADSSAANLKAELTNGDAAFKATLDDLNTRLQRVADAINTRSAIASHTRELPEEAVKALNAAAGHLDSARKALTSRDADTAQRALSNADQELQRIAAIARDWTDDVMQTLNGIDEMRPMPAEVDGAFKVSVAKLIAESQAVSTGVSAADVQFVVKALRNAYVIAAHEINAQELPRLAITAEAVAAELKRQKVDTASLARAANRFRDSLAADTDARLTSLADAAALLDEMSKVLKNAKPGVDQVTQRIVEAVGAGKYIKAARIVGGTMLKTGAAGADIETFSLAAFDHGGSTALVVAAPSITSYVATRVPRERTLRELFCAQAVQFLIAAIGIMLAGFLFLAAAFDGTWGGLLTALFWGYAGDISVDALTDAARKYKT